MTYTTYDLINGLDYKANNIKAYMPPEFFSEASERLHDFYAAFANVRKQPTAQGRPVGHWIEGGTPWISEVDECSECGYRIVYGMDFKFCPMCGADMRGAVR